jgi:hypothetical protein
MAAFAEHGPVPTDGHCLWCGKKLTRAKYDPDPAALGYQGNGLFHSIECGYRFGLWFARQGRRLRSTQADANRAAGRPGFVHPDDRDAD